MNTKNLFTVVATGLFALSGCGPNLVTDDHAANEMGVSGYYYGQSDDANYTCATSPNILPPDDRLMDGTQRYVACANRNSATKIKLVGYSSSSQTICAYPVTFLNSTQFAYKVDGYGQPLFQCYDGWANVDAGTELDFVNTSYNGVVVVDQSYRPQMSMCLMTGQSCPMHAIGQFR